MGFQFWFQYRLIYSLHSWSQNLMPNNYDHTHVYVYMYMHMCIFLYMYTHMKALSKLSSAMKILVWISNKIEFILIHKYAVNHASPQYSCHFSIAGKAFSILHISSMHLILLSKRVQHPTSAEPPQCYWCHRSFIAFTYVIHFFHQVLNSIIGELLV